MHNLDVIFITSQDITVLMRITSRLL